MYSNKFVSSVIVGGQVLQEKADGTVNIPFGATYSIRLENKHDRRALASVYIDERFVGGFVIDSRKKVDILRPANEDRAFLFVKTNSDAAKKSGKQNVAKDAQGVLRIDWCLEQKYEPIKITPHPYEPPPWAPVKPWNPWNPSSLGEPYKPTVTWSSTGSFTSSYSNSVLRSASVNMLAASNNAPERGVTAKGDETGQTFQTVYYNWESDITVHRIVFHGYDAPSEDPLIDVVNFCSNCSRKRKPKEKFCPNCGHKL